MSRLSSPPNCSPHVAVSQYYQEEDDNKDKNSIMIYCQTENQVDAQQGVMEALNMTKAIFSAIGVRGSLALI